MNNLISQCNDFIKDCGFPYAFCGGYALEMFANKSIRTHCDVDLSIFEEDKQNLVNFILNKGWNVYEHGVEWIDGITPKVTLRPILKNDESIPQLYAVWAIKPDCSLFKITPNLDKDNIFDCEILSHEQLNFDFIEIIFNSQKDNNFICNKDKNIIRELDKAILYSDSIPYLSPEVILFMLSNPVYMDGEYYKEKSNLDFNFIAPMLPKESKEWLIYALEAAYPNGHRRIKEFKTNEFR